MAALHATHLKLPPARSLCSGPATPRHKGHTIWLFAGSDTGGRTAAILFSVIRSCERHEVDPFAYLRDVLARLPDQPVNQLDELLPDRWQPTT